MKYLQEKFNKNLLKNTPCCLLGGGPSMTNFNFSKTHGMFVIGTNKSCLHFPVHINYNMDMNFYTYITQKQHRNNIHARDVGLWQKYNGVKAMLEQGKFKFDNQFYAVKHNTKHEISLDIAEGIYPGTNSGFGALMLAISLGAKLIHLYGYDFYTDNTVAPTHYKEHGGYYWHEGSNIDSKLLRFINNFNEFADKIKALGIKVINKNINSKLECFEKEI